MPVYYHSSSLHLRGINTVTQMGPVHAETNMHWHALHNTTLTNYMNYEYTSHITRHIHCNTYHIIPHHRSHHTTSHYITSHLISQITYITCTGCRAVLVLPIPSTVVTAMPSTAHNGNKQPFAEKCLISVKGR